MSRIQPTYILFAEKPRDFKRYRLKAGNWWNRLRRLRTFKERGWINLAKQAAKPQIPPYSLALRKPPSQ